MQDFGREFDGREDFGVSLEEVAGGHPMDVGICASLVEEQVLEGEGGPGDVLGQRLGDSHPFA